MIELDIKENVCKKKEGKLRVYFFLFASAIITSTVCATVVLSFY